MTKKENKIERLTDDVMALICELAIPAGDYVGFRREDAKRLITRILKAVRDSKLEVEPRHCCHEEPFSFPVPGGLED